MATANKEDLLLRQETNAPLSTKGSSFTFKNMDDNFITIYNQLVSLSNSSNVDSYSASKEYSSLTDKYVVYSGQLYECISSALITDVTPDSDSLKWQKVYASDLVQAPNDVRKFRKVIAAADVLTLGITDTPIAVIEAQGANKVVILESMEYTVDFETGLPEGTPYATNTTLIIYNSGIDVAAGESPNAQATSALAAEIQKTGNFAFNSMLPSATRNDNPANNAINVAVATGNPTAGDSDIIITGTYRIIDISN